MLTLSRLHQALFCGCALALLVIALPVLPAQAAELSPEHEKIAQIMIERFLDGETEGVRVVATPVRFDERHEDAFRWTQGDVDIPEGAAWFALADRTPGVLGFHPVTQVFFTDTLELLEVRHTVFYPRFYRDGTRLGLTTLLAYHARPRLTPIERAPVRSASRKSTGGGDFSYNNFYAVIIEGDVPSGSSYSEFWSDPVRMFRMLLEFGYRADHIHVLYGEGHDESNFECEHYREQMVDYRAYQQNVRDLFTWMRDGNAAEGIPQVTDQDFLFLFTFDHGGSNGGCSSTLCLMDGCMEDTEFASYFNQIAYKHRAIDMQQCNSGGFIGELKNAKTVISTASNCKESAYEADERDDCGGGVSVKYGEWNYWWFAAMQGHKPWPGNQPVDADVNDDGMVSFLEAHNYALDNDDRSEHPQWSDEGGIGDEMSLQTSWAGVQLKHSGHEIEDDEGNKDGVSDAGESIVMPVTLKNIGEVNATGVTATLKTGNKWIQVTDDFASFPDMASSGGSARSNPDHFAWNSDAATPDDTDVTFHLDWSSNGGSYTGTVSFHQSVVRVILTVQQSTVDDAAGGDGDGIADPGETIRLAVTLRNKGHAAAHTVEGVLSTNSPWASVTDANANFEDVPARASGRSLAPHFGLTIDAATPDKTWIDCTLDLKAADGYTFNLPLRFMVGTRGTVLLIEDGDAADAELLEKLVEGLGFAVERETAQQTDASAWLSYSLLLWCSGGNSDPLAESARRSELETFIRDGGRLLIEGGELGYDHRYHESFRKKVLHMASWSAHGGGDLRLSDDVHPIATVPNVLDASISQNATESAERDAVAALSDAHMVLDWESRKGKASLIAFDDDSLEGNGGQIVSLFVDAGTLDNSASQRQALVENALEWLLGNDEPYLVVDSQRMIDDLDGGNGDGIADPGETIRLAVSLANHGSGKANGIWARASSDHPSSIAFSDNYAQWASLASSERGESLSPHLVLHISKDTPCGTLVRVTLEITTAEGFEARRSISFKIGTGGGQHLVYEMNESKVIPNPGILDSPIEVDEAFVTGDVNCYVNIDHSTTEKIKVVLRDPDAREVTLHYFEDLGNHLETTYDSQTQPHGPGKMSDYDGKEALGTWHLYVNDLQQDLLVGRLNKWRLIFDTQDLCHGVSCTDPLPAPVGASLKLSRLSGSDVHLEWQASSGATRYAIWRSRRANMSSAETAGTSEGTSFDERGLPQLSSIYYYQVRAENACHEQTP